MKLIVLSAALLFISVGSGRTQTASQSQSLPPSGNDNRAAAANTTSAGGAHSANTKLPPSTKPGRTELGTASANGTLTRDHVPSYGQKARP
jgi:hypothetical protein